MENTRLPARKERATPDEFAEMIESNNYPKPSWMLNKSIFDSTWVLSKTGLELDYNKNLDFGQKLCFANKTSHNELLTDEVNRFLLDDLRNSLLYLNIKGKINRPERVYDILHTACYLLLHANELQTLNNLKPIRNLSEISFEHLKDYLLAFEVERHVFDKNLDFILNQWSSKNEIDWNLLRTNNFLTSRQFNSLKDKLIKYLDRYHVGFQTIPDHGYIRKYVNASDIEFEIDFDLAPNLKTISNEISKLQALYSARPCQKYKFRHSSQDIFSIGSTLFDEIVESKKTPLMPVKAALHTISSALRFVRAYGPSLRKYFSSLSKAEKSLIDSHTTRESICSLREFQRIAYENTPIPDTLSDLKITSWDYENNIDNYKRDFDEGIPVAIAVKLYIAAMWILLATFSSARFKSLISLRRNCFKQSPIDGLFDLVLRIPKSSERWELEEANRPIPDLIYDYGLDFAAFVTEVEERRSLISNDNESFLFSSSLDARSITASTLAYREIKLHRKPTSADSLNENLDIFIDWIEAPLINGKRWYPRTHEFRRFFAVLYFNFSDESGLDELSWFMGHSNLDMTFHYAELAPTDEWIEEAELTISKIGATLNKNINADKHIRSIVDTARNTSNISTVIEPLVRKLIDEHKEITKQEVRFCRIDGEEVFFYFSEREGV